MRLLEGLQAGTPGYFQAGAENQFPWTARSKAVWYALFVVEDGRIERYGYTSSGEQRGLLCQSLQKAKGREALLVGVWTGQWGTHLFVLDPGVALQRLAE